VPKHDPFDEFFDNAPTSRSPSFPESDEATPWSTWDRATHGPEPFPDWLVTDLAALDTDLGVLKTGKEADVHLLRRALPGGPECLLAAKRYRPAERRLFHRDAGYAEGRRVRRSRETRAMARRTEFGRELLAGQWAGAEFAALSALRQIGAPVPYPVQLLGTDVLLEFIGDTATGIAAPRLAQCRPTATELADLFDQVRGAMRLLARAGYAHGDLSAYNLLLRDGALVMIDLPQVVDLVANPQGPQYLRRDCENVCRWFTARGFADAELEYLYADLMAEAVGSW
jgi:RIO kinase 1